MQPLPAETLINIDAAIEKRRIQGDVEGLIEDLKEVLTNTWAGAVRESLITTISTLQAIPGPVTADELELIERQVAGQLGMPLDVAKQRNILSIERAAYALGMNEAVKGAGVKISWDLPDAKSLDVLDRDCRFWIGSHYNDNLQEGFKAVLQDYFEGGYNRRDLAELMKTHFRTLGDKGAAYWDLLADHTVTKTREIGRVSGYEKAGIEVVRVKARLDSKTSEICRRLHGTVIAVKDLRGQVDRYLTACESGDKAKIKAAWPWWSDAQAENLQSQKAINRQVARGKIGPPPYHARCRTITVAEFFAQAGDNSDGSAPASGQEPSKPAPPLGTVRTYADVERVIVSKLGHLGGDNPIRMVKAERGGAGSIMWTYSAGDVFLSTTKTAVTWTGATGFQEVAAWSPAGSVMEAFIKINRGEQLAFLEEYSLESLWHEIQHNRQNIGVSIRIGKKSQRRMLMEVVNQWTARRTYPTMLKELGLEPAHLEMVKTQGLGYRGWIRNFDTLLSKLGIRDDDILDKLVQINEGVNRWNFKPPVVDVLFRAQEGEVARDKIGEVLDYINKDVKFNALLIGWAL